MSPRASAKKTDESEAKPAASATKKASGTTKKATGGKAEKATGAAARKATGAAAKKATGTTAKKSEPTKKAAEAAAKKAPETTKKASGTTAKKATKKATPAPEPEEVAASAAASADDHAGHDHDHGHDQDHEGHDHDEITDEEQAQAEADLEQMGRALAALDDATLRNALAGMSEKSRQEVATHLQLPRATMYLGDALMPIVRRKLTTTGPEHQLQVLFALAQHANDQTVELLGKRAEDPTKEDLLEVLPAVIDANGVELVTLMLAGYTASDAICRPVMRDILETDDRFVIGDPVAVEARPELGALPAPTLSDAELEAKREQRRAAKEAKRQAQLREREARATAQAKRREAVHNAKRKTR